MELSSQEIVQPQKADCVVFYLAHLTADGATVAPLHCCSIRWTTFPTKQTEIETKKE
jgi:hypothetical protein